MHLESKIVKEEFGADLSYLDPNFPEKLARVLRHLCCENGCDPATLEVFEAPGGTGLHVRAFRERTESVLPGLPGEYLDKDPAKDTRAQAKLLRAERRAAERLARQAQPIPPAEK